MLCTTSTILSSLTHTHMCEFIYLSILGTKYSDVMLDSLERWIREGNTLILNLSIPFRITCEITLHNRLTANSHSVGEREWERASECVCVCVADLVLVWAVMMAYCFRRFVVVHVVFVVVIALLHHKSGISSVQSFILLYGRCCSTYPMIHYMYFILNAGLFLFCRKREREAVSLFLYLFIDLKRTELWQRWSNQFSLTKHVLTMSLAHR